VPEPLAPVPLDSVTAWVGVLGPTRPTALRFRWRYRDERRSIGGRGTARVAPPDSLRVDWAAILGLSPGAAVVVGDSLQWADPRDDYPSSVAPAVQLLWTTLGVVRPPRAGTAVFGARDSTRVLWRFVEQRDTLDFRLRSADANARSGVATRRPLGGPQSHAPRSRGTAVERTDRCPGEVGAV
jgi:hypothetical protein